MKKIVIFTVSILSDSLLDKYFGKKSEIFYFIITFSDYNS